MRTDWVSIFCNLTLALILGFAPTAVWAKLYKWVDERGMTHYGEIIPPEYKDRESLEMNKRGVVLRRNSSAFTPEQRRLMEEAAAREREVKQRLFDQRRRDLALTNTYTSSKEIDDARERNVALPRQAIKGLEPRLKKAEDKLATLEAQANNQAKAGKVLSEHLKDDIHEQRMEVDAVRRDIARHQAQIDSIKARFDTDKQRYIELTQR